MSESEKHFELVTPRSDALYRLQRALRGPLTSAERTLHARSWAEKERFLSEPHEDARLALAALGLSMGFLTLLTPWGTVAAALSASFGLSRARSMLRGWALRAPLAGMPMTFIRFEALLERLAGEGAMKRLSALSPRARATGAALATRLALPPISMLYLGEGFQWDATRTQRLYTLMELPEARLRVSNTVRRLFGYPDALQDDAVGIAMMHGVGLADETPIMVPLSAMGGGTLIVGTTQSGKGVVLTNLVAQAIYRGEPVIVIDPKSSPRLKNAIREACRTAGRAAPLEFHPAFPREGVRLDPLGSWSRATELASRITALLPAESDIFNDFAWSAVNVIVEGLLYLEEKPTLLKIRHLLEAGIEEILERAIEKDLDERAGDAWRDEMESKDIPRENRFGEPIPRVRRLAAFWESGIGKDLYGAGPAAIHPLLSVYWHNPEHYAKITASLMPVLAMLTSGTLAQTLSPDANDLTDPRMIVTLERVLEAGDVLYLGLDALPDSTVARALGSLLLADLTAYAGKRYNLGRSGVSVGRISLFVDETANVINRPLIELLNKGMEAGVHVTAAMQTVADLTAALGNEARAHQALANFNNLIALRTKDSETQRFVLEAFGRAEVWREGFSIGTAAAAEVAPNFRASLSKSASTAREDLIPQELLGRLPNGEFFASIAGGRILKARMPIVTNTAEEPVHEEKED